MSSPLDEWVPMPAPNSWAWLSMLAGRGVFDELALDHVGVAVEDVDAAMERFGARLGLHDWIRATFSTTSTYRGVEQVIGGNVATAAMGPINLELVQPTQGSWTPRDVLETRGEGLYHLGFRVPDLAAAAQRAQEAGYQVELLAAHGKTPMFTYMERDELFGVCVELVGPAMPQGMVTSTEPVP
jgi:catechol 2,3-dioxygenase-like lactoylglutathione lyase family enzyme